MAAKKGLELRNDLPQDTPSVLADGEKLRQILHNLLGNAVKFTEKGHVSLQALRQEQHLKIIGMLKDETIGEHQQQILDEKRAQYEASQNTTIAKEDDDCQYPDGATVCTKCSTKAVIMMDGCMTCLSCGDSKCG